MKKRLPCLLAMGICLFTASPAWADRPPTAEERAKIEKVLRAQGYVSWEHIEFEDKDGRWEVDDARTAEGQEYNLELEAGTFRVVRREAD